MISITEQRHNHAHLQLAVVGDPGLAKGAGAQAFPGHPRRPGPMPMDTECEELFLVGEEQDEFGGLLRCRAVACLDKHCASVSSISTATLLRAHPLRFCAAGSRVPSRLLQFFTPPPPPPAPQRKFHRVSWRELRLRESPSAAVSDCPRSASFSFSRKTEECGQKPTSRNPDSSLPTFVERGSVKDTGKVSGLAPSPSARRCPSPMGSR